MLTDEMKYLIRNFSAGSVATINADGTPSVSPKATFVIIDDTTLAFGNLRSPGTLANLRANPAVEICFTDVLARKAARVTGTGKAIRKTDASPEVNQAFEEFWAPYVESMSAYVVIDVTAAELILSPGYDIGLTEAELKETNLAKLNALCDHVLEAR